jgi:hypothetical protein
MSPNLWSVGLASCLVLAGTAGLVAIVGVVAPPVAPDVMTMDTMASCMGQERYQDEGTCDLWVVNMSSPADRIERTFPCSFYWDWSHRDNGTAHVQEALLDLEEDRIFQVPHMDRGRMEEWYHVDGHMLTDDALSFTVGSRRDPGVLMPPPDSEDSVTMGWVTSGGERGGEEKLLHPRDLQALRDTRLEGLEVRHWRSSFTRERVTWHGYDVYMSEDVDMWSDPQTAWVLKMRRHIVVEMTAQQMAEATGQPAPPESGDDEPRKVMEFTYESTAEAGTQHADQAWTFQAMMVPIRDGPTVTKGGLAAAASLAALGLAGRTVRNLLEPSTGTDPERGGG